MAATRRAIPRHDFDGGPNVVARAAPGAPTCTRTIKLDGTTYDCKREVRRFDRQHDGIHDALAEHPADQGAVRW